MTAKQEREIVEWARHPRIIAYARKSLPRHLSPHDAIQETVEHAYKRLPADHPTAAKWLTCDLKFTCANICRYERRRYHEPISAAGGTTTPSYHDPINTSRFTPGERKALGALAFGYSYDEIGKMYNWSRTKVNRCLYEGRAKMREALEA